MQAPPLTRLEDEIRIGTFRKITSVLAARGGDVVYEHYVEGDAETLRNTRSVTKTVAGMLIGIAIERGEIRGVDVPLLSFFDDLAPVAHDGPAKRQVTLEDVLTMSSAFDCDDYDPDSPGNEELMYETPDWLRFAVDLPMRDAADRGTWRYCTAGVTALAGVLERATGRSLEAYASEQLFGPLGIIGAQWTHAPSGLAMTGGGLELRSRDLLALGQLALDGGRRGDRQVLPSAWVTASMTAHRHVDDALTDYGYLWWLRTMPLGDRAVQAAMMQGNGGNKVAVIPELDAVVVITSTNFGTRGMHEQTDTILVEHVLPSL
jgi:CubicO group peptidase (beta-lactamase class C family)